MDRRAIAALAVALAACAHGPEEPPPSKGTVRGMVHFESEDRAYLLECVTRRKYVLGAMGSAGPAMRFRERYERLSEGGKQPVYAEFTGTLTHSKDGGTIEQPSLLKIKAEKCKEDR